jgi:hypothetical protein
MIRRYRESASDPVRALLFHQAPVASLLAQPGCAGVRIYPGRDSAGSLHLVLVGVDVHGEDQTAGVLLQEGWPCPPFCSLTSALIREGIHDPVATAA